MIETHPIFRSDYYAAMPHQKIRRSLELGPRYYFRDVPRYWHERRRSAGQLIDLDLQVLWNPLHEFGFLGKEPLEPPPGLDGVLDRLNAEGLRIMLKPERFLAVCTQFWRAAQGDASILECGSYQGATGLALALLGKLHGFSQHVHLFDLFGSQAEIMSAPVDGARTANEFAMEAGYADDLRRLADKLGVGDRVTVHDGLFEETFPGFVAGPFPCRFAHIDANYYSSTLQACKFVMPLLADRAIVVFDDYHGITDLGARLAIDQVFGTAQGAIRRLSGTSAVLTFERNA